MSETIFMGGSRISSSRGIPTEVAAIVEWVIEHGHRILVGDAAGADLAFQHCAARHGYKAVTVYHSTPIPRHIVDKEWDTQAVGVDSGLQGRELLMLKDKAMAAEATRGLMILDPVQKNRFGKLSASKGTLSNIVELLQGGKEVLVYHVPRQKMYHFTSLEQCQRELLAQHPADTGHEVLEKAWKTLIPDTQMELGF